MPSSHAETETRRITSLVIVGVGLIGGSIALAAKSRGLTDRVIGIGRRQERLDAAVRAGVIDEGLTKLDRIPGDSFVVICTPVDQIVRDCQQVLEHLGEEGIVTDAGSVKASIVQNVCQLQRGNQFVGSHPLAGSEKSGFEHAQSRLFQGRTCIVTFTKNTKPEAFQRVNKFWEQLGMAVHVMSPETHDSILAATSHLPHLAASAIASLLNPQAAPFAATGFRDTTRVASGDPELWSAILSENRAEVARFTIQLMERLEAFRVALASDNRDALRQLLAEGASARQLFLKSFNASTESD